MDIILNSVPVILLTIVFAFSCPGEFGRRKRTPSYSGFLQALMSWPAAIAIVVVDCLSRSSTPDPGICALAVVFALSCLISCPAPDDDKAVFFFLSAGAFIILFSTLLARDILSQNIAVPTLITEVGIGFAAGLLIVVSTVVKTVHKFTKVRALFSNEQVWKNVIDYSSMLFSLVTLFLVLFLLLSMVVGGVFMRIVILLVSILSVSFYYIMFRRRRGDRSMFLSKKKDIHIQAIIRGRLKDNIAPEDDSDGRHMNSMYKRVLNFMEEKKPYLDDNFSLKSLSTSMYTNKVYLSKTINSLSGRNFSQFVNYHRINYSMNLLKEDPRLKINEVALMSGFHTVVSYNMAFKLFNNETPSDWIRRNRASDSK